MSSLRRNNLPREPNQPHREVRVWDLAVRFAHWGLVASVALGWITTIERFSAIGGWHQPAGYVALAVVTIRSLWGFGPSRYARFAQFVRSPRETYAYARALIAHREPRHLGHNPLGAWMILAFFGCVIGLAITGWLYTTDLFFGDETVDVIHQILAWAMLGLIVVHVCGVIFTSFRQRENLVRAMFSGKKSAARDADVD